jgi:hypothetical protein
MPPIPTIVIQHEQSGGGFLVHFLLPRRRRGHLPLPLRQLGRAFGNVSEVRRGVEGLQRRAPEAEAHRGCGGDVVELGSEGGRCMGGVEIGRVTAGGGRRNGEMAVRGGGGEDGRGGQRGCGDLGE